MTATKTTVLCFCAAALLAAPASALVTATWEIDSYSDWNEGEATHALISSHGEVRPGWDTTRTAVEVDASWSAVRAADGTIVLGTDADGAIYTVRAGKAAKLVAIEGAVAIPALALGRDGALYAGTMPGGAIWRVDLRAGGARKVVELPGAETVWALAFDAGGNTLYAGTGPEGKLFAIDVKSGKAEVAFATEDKRVMSVLGARDGSIWLGTSEDAVLYRYDPAAKNARAMADFEGNEITALAEVGDGVVAAANNFVEPSTTGPKTRSAATQGEKKLGGEGEPAKTPKTGSEPGADDAPPSGGAIARPNARKGKGALFRVGGDGSLEQLHALTQTYYTSLAAMPGGKVLAGAGDEGRVYLVEPDGATSTAFDVEERQVLQVLADGEHIAFTTGDAAACYEASGPAKKSEYVSKVFDAKTSARFGSLVWQGAGAVTVDTRTGNTAEPGKGWSAWQPVKGVGRTGGEGQGGKVASPPGRYVQLRLSFGAEAKAVVRRAVLYHVPHNRPTEITELKIGAASGRELVTMQASVPKPRSPVVKVSWKVENPDGDETVYLLAVRRDGEATWRMLSPVDKPVSGTDYDWNTETYADGYYQLRLTATDRQANSADRVLERDEISPVFLVDNGKPQVSAVTVKYPAVSARATDALSAIAEMSYSVDDGPWQLGGAQDGIFDDPSELLTFGLPARLEAGLHTLSIRVADAAGNLGTTSVSFQVGK